jgi:hypothetical protein
MLEERWQLTPGYRVAPLLEHEELTADDVVAVWINEGVLDPEEARRRVSEILLVATDQQGRVAGVCTTYLARNDQLRADMWYFRTFVAADHRQFNLAVTLALQGRDYLVSRYVSGEDRRGLGIIFEVENAGLQQHFPEALWLPTDFLFIGENARGAHVRVHYFPGALAPDP